MKERTYIAIDLKSFYASVECVARGLDPLTTHLVVADISRTEKTICLAVTPSLKEYGISGRARLFEVVKEVKNINNQRRRKAPARQFTGKSFLKDELQNNPSLELDYIVAVPRMELYEKISAQIVSIYQQFVSPDDIHVYSIDEVFMDVTDYLKCYKITAHELARKMIREVLSKTGITATVGIGTNLYLCKIAMDIVAKHIPADRDGVRIAELNEMSYRNQLWGHRPLTDFWRIGHGYADKLEKYGLFTMGDIAYCSLRNEPLLYKLFGINAELLIDHAWGYEPCTISDIKKYVPSAKSLGSGQVLMSPYRFEKGKLIAREMADALVLEMVQKRFVTDQIALYVGYDTSCFENEGVLREYGGEIVTDAYGRKKPKSVHGSLNLGGYSCSSRLIMQAVSDLYERLVDKALFVRRIGVTATHIVDKDHIPDAKPKQLDLFTDYSAEEEKRQTEAVLLEKERKIQEAVISVHQKFGKNAIVRGMNLEEGATTIERNNQIGGHKK